MIERAPPNLEKRGSGPEQIAFEPAWQLTRSFKGTGCISSAVSEVNPRA